MTKQELSTVVMLVDITREYPVEMPLDEVMADIYNDIEAGEYDEHLFEEDLNELCNLVQDIIAGL